MGERSVRIRKVEGSNPFRSIKNGGEIAVSGTSGSLKGFGMFLVCKKQVFYDIGDQVAEKWAHLSGGQAWTLFKTFEALTKMSMEWGRGPGKCEFL